jgi:O-succinylbenzoic acid--CoA ligase
VSPTDDSGSVDGSGVATIDVADPGEAAAAIREHWSSGRPFMVLDPRDPAARRASRRSALRRAPLTAGAALVVATSGTTASPRLVVHGRAPVLASCGAVNEALDTDASRDRWLACVPLHSVAGLAIVLRGATNGVPVTVHGSFNVEAVARATDDCSLVSLVPTQLKRLLDSGVPLERFRAVLLGGGPAPPGLLERAREGGVAVHTTYGLTETFGGCVHDGHPLSGVELSLAPGSAGETSGEILVRGPVMLGYHGAPDETERAFTSDGSLRTGDVGQILADGRLRVVDRLRDFVISGGVNVSPSAVEAVLTTDPSVLDVAVIGAPDPEWGERVVACVIPADQDRRPTLAGLRDRAREHLSAAELPRELRLVDAIPRTSSGKVRRAELRALTASGNEP